MRHSVLAVLLIAAAARADEALRLRESFPAGTRLFVKTRVELTGTLTPPPTKGKAPSPVKIQGTSAIDYEERVLTVTPKGDVSKTVRSYERLDFRRTLAGQQQELALRPAVKRLVVLRKGHTEVPFSPDGPLTWGEMDAVRTDIFIPALIGLLPDRAVREGDRWRATDAAAQELTDLEKLEEGALECKLEKIVHSGRRRLARVSFSGTVKGVGEDGTARHRIQGTYHFDLDAGRLSDLVLTGTLSLLDKDGKEMGRIDGRFAMQRSDGGRAEGLGDAGLRGVKLEPDAENTLILHDSPDQGARFLYPRAWRVARSGDGQIALDGPEGSGLLITLDTPGKTPTSRQLLDESRQWLEKRKGTVLRAVPAATLRASPRLETFSVEAQLGGQRFWMDYYVTTQAAGGATVAARLVPAGLSQSRKEVEAIARSIVLRARR